MYEYVILYTELYRLHVSYDLTILHFFTVPSNIGILLSCIADFTTHTRLWPHMSLTLQHTHVYDHICHYFTCSKFSNLLVATSLYHHTEFTFFSNIWLFPYNVWYMLQFLSSSHLHIQINVCTKYCITYCNFSIFCGGVPVSSYRAYFSKKCLAVSM